MVIKKISIEDYIEKTVLYSKQIRGQLQFYVETQQSEAGKKVQIHIYRNHPRIKEFIAVRDRADNFSEQKSKFKTTASQLKINVNDSAYIFNCNGETTVNIVEINYNQQLQDLDKGKCAILIDFTLSGEMENSKMLSDISIAEE